MHGLVWCMCVAVVCRVQEFEGFKTKWQEGKDLFERGTQQKLNAAFTQFQSANTRVQAWQRWAKRQTTA